MAANWERYLDRWSKAGLIEPAKADVIRAYEFGQKNAQGLRWPIILAIALGGFTIGAGILLFVAAHWDMLSPTQRFIIILLTVAIMHAGGALTATRYSILSTVLHAVGTICLGAGIFLTGQIFHLQEHWPGGVMLWALGAWVAWAVLHDWPQAVLGAILTPAWIVGEWSVATQGWTDGYTIAAAALLSLSITYLTAIVPEKDTYFRKALLWIGGLTLLPAAALVAMSGQSGNWQQHPMPSHYHILGWSSALLFPLILAWWLRGHRVLLNAVAAAWVAVLSVASLQGFYIRSNLLLYALYALGSIGLIAWGLKEIRKERVNLGIAGFAITVLSFYFSAVMDKLGRSASLISIGVLFLLGGWLLEKTRRRLIEKIGKGAA